MPRPSLPTSRRARLGAAIAAAALAAPSAVLAGAALPDGGAHPELDLRGQNRLTLKSSDVGGIADSSTWTDVPGAHATISSKTPGAVVVRFSGESACYDTFTCNVRVLVDGQSALPGDVSGVAFDDGHTDGTSEAHAVERSTGVLPAGEHAVKVQFRLFLPEATGIFYLNDWHLAVEHAPV